MAKKIKIKVDTKLIGVYEVFEAENEVGQASLLEAKDVPAKTSRINRVWLARLDACWYVHQDEAYGGGWWGSGDRPCPPDSIFKIKLDASGKIWSVEQKIGSEAWTALYPMTQPAGVAFVTSIEIRDDDAIKVSKTKIKFKIRGPCRYVIVGGRAYKVC